MAWGSGRNLKLTPNLPPKIESNNDYQNDSQREPQSDHVWQIVTFSDDGYKYRQLTHELALF